MVAFFVTSHFPFYQIQALQISNNLIIFPVLPQIHHFDFGSEPVNVGDTVSVQCTILKGDSPLNFTWKSNNRTIDSGQGISIINMKRVSVITMESVHAKHSGTYECIATNIAGYSSYSAELNINGIQNKFVTKYCGQACVFNIFLEFSHE